MRRSRLNILSIASLAAVLAGCASVPPGVMIASQAFQGLSYATTGKSGTDHALSVAMAEDCALHRMVTGGAVCQDDDDPSQVIAAVRSKVEGGELRLSPPPGDHVRPAPAVAADVSLSVTPASGTPERREPLPSWTPVPRTFVVVATYGTRPEAERASGAIRDIPGYPLLRPKVVSTLALGGPVYRLVVGPLDPDSGRALREAFARKGYASVAAIPGCDGAVTLACVDTN